MKKSKRATIAGVPSAKIFRTSAVPKSFRKSSASGSSQFRKLTMPTTKSFYNSTSPAWRKSKRNTVADATKKYRKSKRHSLDFLSEDSISSTSMIKKAAQKHKKMEWVIQQVERERLEAVKQADEVRKQWEDAAQKFADYLADISGIVMPLKSKEGENSVADDTTDKAAAETLAAPKPDVEPPSSSTNEKSKHFQKLIDIDKFPRLSDEWEAMTPLNTMRPMRMSMALMEMPKEQPADTSQVSSAIDMDDIDLEIPRPSVASTSHLAQSHYPPLPSEPTPRTSIDEAATDTTGTLQSEELSATVDVVNLIEFAPSPLPGPAPRPPATTPTSLSTSPIIEQAVATSPSTCHSPVVSLPAGGLTPPLADDGASSGVPSIFDLLDANKPALPETTSNDGDSEGGNGHDNVGRDVEGGDDVEGDGDVKGGSGGFDVNKDVEGGGDGDGGGNVERDGDVEGGDDVEGNGDLKGGIGGFGVNDDVKGGGDGDGDGDVEGGGDSNGGGDDSENVDDGDSGGDGGNGISKNDADDEGVVDGEDSGGSGGENVGDGDGGGGGDDDNDGEGDADGGNDCHDSADDGKNSGRAGEHDSGGDGVDDDGDGDKVVTTANNGDSVGNVDSIILESQS